MLSRGSSAEGVAQLFILVHDIHDDDEDGMKWFCMYLDVFIWAWDGWLVL